jgi:hypothetical protein
MIINLMENFQIHHMYHDLRYGALQGGGVEDDVLVPRGVVHQVETHHLQNTHQTSYHRQEGQNGAPVRQTKYILIGE